MMAAPLWVGRFLPLLDLPQHLAITTVLLHHDDPAWQLAAYFEPQRGELTPYWAHYLALEGLGRVMPVDAAARVFLSLYVFALPWAAMALARALGRPPALGLLAVPLALNANLYYGFIAYCWSVVLLLWALALLARQLDAPRRGARRRPRAARGGAVLHPRAVVRVPAPGRRRSSACIGDAPAWRRALRAWPLAPATLALFLPWLYLSTTTQPGVERYFPALEDPRAKYAAPLERLDRLSRPRSPAPTRTAPTTGCSPPGPSPSPRRRLRGRRHERPRTRRPRGGARRRADGRRPRLLLRAAGLDPGAVEHRAALRLDRRAAAPLPDPPAAALASRRDPRPVRGDGGERGLAPRPLRPRGGPFRSGPGRRCRRARACSASSTTRAGRSWSAGRTCTSSSTRSCTAGASPPIRSPRMRRSRCACGREARVPTPEIWRPGEFRYDAHGGFFDHLLVRDPARPARRAAFGRRRRWTRSSGKERWRVYRDRSQGDEP